MSSGGQGHGGRNMVIALLLIPVFFFTFLIGIALISDTTSEAVCDPSAGAVSVDPTSVPGGPVAGYNHDQLVNAAHIMLAAQRLSLTVRDQRIGVMTAMGDSALTALDKGDDLDPNKRGLFQQPDKDEWGTLADRMDPSVSSTNFFKVELGIEGREAMEPTLVANAVQRKADPYYYASFWDNAGLVVEALAGVTPLDDATGAGQTGSTYSIGPVQPQAATVANSVGPLFGIKTTGGYRDPATEQYDPNGHPAGLALDFMINDIPNGKDTGDRLSKHLQDHAADLGVKYVIWQQRLWAGDRADEGWRPMEDRGSPTQNHMDHVHLSLTGHGSAQTSQCKVTAGQVGQVTQSGWAAPAKAAITSTYGGRVNPVTGASEFHSGLDIGAGCDAPIFAANTGTVVVAGPIGGYGNLIEIDHDGGVHTRYGHMYNAGVLVNVGDHVTAGQQIGKVGSNGNSDGCHLHLEVLRDGQHVDPQAFLDNAGVTTN